MTSGVIFPQMCNKPQVRKNDLWGRLSKIMNFKELLNNPEYSFLKTDPRLKDRIMLLGVSGSYGYGTNREGSDIDLRGVTPNLPSDLLGLTSFEQFEDRKTDTVIYSFGKLTGLLLNCNPNTIEILGLNDDQYLIKSALGQELLDHRDLFLSKRAAASFGHYAEAQLRRLLAGERMRPDQAAVDVPLQRAVLVQHPGDAARHARAEVVAHRPQHRHAPAYIDGTFTHYPLRKFTEMANTLGSVVRDYDKIGKRNHKKDDNHLNKHAMHLVRLFMMGIDILADAQIRTRRPDSDLVLLRGIRDGAYMENGVLNAAFYEIVADYERRFVEAERSSALPDEPDIEAVGRFVESVNRRVIAGEV